MTPLREYLLQPMQENGRTYPFTRLDIVFSIVIAVALMAAIAYSAEATGWTHKRAVIIVAVTIGVFVLGQNRRAILGGAFGVLALRSMVGIMAGDQAVVFMAITAASATAAWLLLRSLH